MHVKASAMPNAGRGAFLKRLVSKGYVVTKHKKKQNHKNQHPIVIDYEKIMHAKQQEIEHNKSYPKIMHKRCCCHDYQEDD